MTQPRTHLRPLGQCYDAFHDTAGGSKGMALGDKRSTVEYEEDDTEAAHAANRNGPRKVRRLSTEQITFAPESSRAPKRPTVDPRSREALQTLQPPLPKAKSKPATKKYGGQHKEASGCTK